MNNLTFSVNTVTGLSVRFLSVFFCLFVVCATAEAGNTFKYNYSVTVAPQTSNPGRGKVYMDAKAAFLYEDKTKWADLSDSKNTELYNANQTLTVSVSKDNEDKTNQKSPWIEYTSVTLKAEALAGSKFTKWSWTENSEEKSSTAVTISIPCPEILQMNPNNKDDTESKSCSITYTAHFTPRTYYYKMPGADANEGGKVYISTTAGRPAEDSGDWQTKIAAGTTALSQTADDNGRYAKATIKIYCYAQSPGDDYEFVGWFAATGSVISTSLDYEYAFEAKSEKSNSPTANTLHAVFRPKNNVTRITKDNVETIELYTGTELFVEGDATYGKFPYRKKTRLDLRATFAPDGTPLFNTLYIFGMTTSHTSKTVSGQTGYKITPASTSAGSDAITPCYIFTKNDNAYSLTTTVVNMNTEKKDPNFKITANGQKVYFTGYCPYATSGFATDQYGAVEFTGGANKKIDIYLENLYLTARYHTADGRTSETENDIIVCNISLTGITYIPASCAAFAFTTTNTNTSTPFQPTIHVLGSNELEGGKGAVRATVMGAVNREAGLHSSPIHIVPTKDKQCTSLSIDDLWPTDASGNTSHTNGILDVAPSSDGRPSIDIGNEYSTVNVNGGQLFVKNSLPTSTSYLSTFAIGYRHYSQTSSVPVIGDVTVTLTGVGNDQGGGNVNFNDGTINCRPLTAANIEKYPYYRDTESMKCPTNTKINGGTYNCNIWACDAAANLGGLPTNSVGSELASLKVPVISEATAPYYLAKINFADNPGQLKNAVADDANFGETLNDYYTRNNISYGHSSMMAVAAKNDGEPDSVMLMIPYQYTGKDVVEDVTVDNWALCVPTMSASGAGDLTFGGPITVSSDETHQTNFLLYASLDDYVTGLQDYTIPDVGLGDNVQITFNQEDIFHENIQNTEPYRIEEAQYFFQAVRGDEWMLFSPPFDVTNVYILESYPEADLIEVAKTSLPDAYDLQARAATDLFFYLTFDAVVSDSRGNMWEIYRKWRENSKLTKGAGAIKLTHFTGSNYDANYYLQRSSGTWEWNSEKSRFVTDWEYLPATMEKVTHGDEEYDVVMKKGQIYSINFPYMYYGYRDSDNDGDGNGNWDYWTGKYVIFEGLGPQTIEGKNYHQTIKDPTMVVPSGSAEIRANSTFASMEVSGMGAYYLDENQRFTPSPDDSEPKAIDATQGFVLLNETTVSPMPQRIKSIDLISGDVTLDGGDGTATGTPTIAGNNKMLVYSIDGGVGIVPVVAQQVRIYNAAGQMVTSQYLTSETQIPLPTGIYLITGEKEQCKVMVK